MTEMRDGTVTDDPRLGRLVEFDERSRDYPMRALTFAGQRRRSYSWRLEPGQDPRRYDTALDQGRYRCPICGQTGACTGYAAALEAEARPVEVSGVGDVLAHKLYHRAQELDRWPETRPVPGAAEGSSVIAAVKAGVELGLWYEYRWALGPGPEAAENDVALTVGYRGPVLVGTNWYEGMFRPDADGWLNVSGRVAGGHAYLLNRYSAKRDAYYTPNSWGGAGAGWIRRADLVRLLGEWGEAVITLRKAHPERTG